MLDSHPLLPVTLPPAPEPAVVSYMPVTNVAPLTIPVDFASQGAEWGLWTPIRTLILECELANQELANHPNKPFVRQLISDLQHDRLYRTTIFSHLSSALRHHQLLTPTSRKRLQLGILLDHMIPHLSHSFAFLVWVSSPNMTEDEESFTISLPPIS